MLKFRRKEEKAALSVQTRPEESFRLAGGAPSGPGERRLYRALRESVPIIDAAIGKLRRLLGEFTVSCPQEQAQRELEEFLQSVPVNAMEHGVQAFLGVYFEQLLTYGNAVGEMVLGGGQVAALYNASLDGVELEPKGPLEAAVSVWEGDRKRPCPYPELLLLSALAPEAGSIRGTSLLRGLPFVSEILLKIYKTLGVNWDRLGNVRFAVTCKPDPSGLYAGDRARQMAEEWRRAMHSREVSDFVAVGDVSIKAIGADNQILDSEVPVRQMLEQIVAKLGVPPFLLGLSWSSTERMSSQQADMLTSELDAYRGLLTPVIQKICRTWLTLAGYDPQCRVEWEQITMQDEVDHANARYLNARARQLERKEETCKRAWCGRTPRRRIWSRSAVTPGGPTARRRCTPSPWCCVTTRWTGTLSASPGRPWRV